MTPISPMRYPNPPITEAVIDIRMEMPEDFALESLQQFASKLEGDYSCDEIRQQSGELSFDSDGETVMPQINAPHVAGYRLTNATSPFVLQIFRGAFIFSRLEPYESWATLKEEAMRLWELYCETVHFGPLKRVATRYINRIDIPEQEVELTRYFRTLPELSSDMPQPHMGRYQMQIHLPQPDMEANAILNQALVPPDTEGETSIMLDVDLFRTDNLPGQDTEMWTLLDTLRDRKNEIFEASITNRTRRLFG